MKNIADSRSRWWWIQKGVALVGTIVLAYWLLSFIRAATMSMSVTSIGVLSPQNLAVAHQEVAGGKKTDVAETADAIRVPTVTVRQGQNIIVAAGLQPDIADLPSAVKQRIEWVGLMLGNNGAWSAVPIIRGKGSMSACGVQATQPGTFLVLVGLPPASLSRLTGRPSSYITRFLTSSALTRCRAIQLVVSAQESSKMASPISADTVGVTVELRGQSGGASPPPPTSPPSQQEQKKTDTEQAGKHADAQTRAAKPEMPKRDLSMTHQGEKEDGVVDTREDSVKERGSRTQPSPVSISVPSVVPSKPAPVKITWGTLPETSLDYTPTEIAKLSTGDWDVICRTHGMPFVAVPNPNHYAELGGWVVMTPDGAKKTMNPDDVERAFGLKFLALSSFSDDVQTTVRSRFNDPVGWFKCSGQKGFLLSTLLLEAIQAGLEKQKISPDRAADIKRVTVSLSIDGSSGQPRFVASAKSVEMKQ